jgi:predicted nuclease of predicted toxin-antitoxin system
MKFLLDENTEFRLAAFLQERGHDVTAIAHDYPASITDRQVLTIAASEQRVLLTNDHDFGELIFRHHLGHSGVVLFRLTPGDLETKQTWMMLLRGTQISSPMLSLSSLSVVYACVRAAK